MSDPDADVLARRCAEAMWAKDNASQRLNMHLRQVSAGRAVMTMVVQDHMTNGWGTCHGAYIAAVAAPGGQEPKTSRKGFSEMVANRFCPARYPSGPSGLNDQRAVARPMPPRARTLVRSEAFSRS